MNKLRLFVTLATALAIAAGLSLADESKVKSRFKFKVDSAGEAIVVDDLAVGETRQFFTDSGKEVVVTRGDDGFHLTVDGKEIDVVGPHGFHGASVIDLEGEEGGSVKVIVKKVGVGEESEHVMVWHGAGHEAHGDHGFAFVIQPDVAEHVVESGVLDDLAPEKREEILRVIREADRRVIRHRAKVVVDDEDEDDK